MSRSMDDLQPGFRATAEKAIALCAEDGYELRPFYTLRDVWEQSKLWRQSRPRSEVEAGAQKLKANGAIWLAEVLMEVGPQNGRWATNALPGLSWHQHGEAIDCFVAEGNKASWSARHPGYKAWGTHAKSLGLTAGYFWSQRDAVHVQLRPERVLKRYSWAELDQLMQNRFQKA